jgi:hypothetical protein
MCLEYHFPSFYVKSVYLSACEVCFLKTMNTWILFLIQSARVYVLNCRVPLYRYIKTLLLTTPHLKSIVFYYIVHFHEGI